jgi:hypothetical protein
MRTARVVLSPEAEKVYYYLSERAKGSKIERSIVNAVKKKSELIKANFQYGDPLPKKLIPKEYIARYGPINLFRVELSDYWRMVYTVRGEEGEIEVVAFVLDILDHDTYDKKFGYAKK